MDIGPKIKTLRTQMGLTQEELANRAELSKGFISQLENDLTSPSIATLMDILQCLGTDLREFFSEGAEEEQVVFSEEDFFEKEDIHQKNTIRWIVPNAQKNQMEPILISLEENGSTGMDTPHEGEEFGFLLKGQVDIHIGKRLYRAKKGEAFYYSAAKTHGITCASKDGAEFIWVSTPPNF